MSEIIEDELRGTTLAYVDKLHKRIEALEAEAGRLTPYVDLHSAVPKPELINWVGSLTTCAPSSRKWWIWLPPLLDQSTACPRA